MVGLYGADVAQLRSLGEDLARAAEVLATTSGRLTGIVESSPWHGRDAERFRAGWHGSSLPLLRGVSTSLAEAAQVLERNAEQQEATSSAAGSGIPGGGSPGSPGHPTAPGVPAPPGLDGSIWTLGGVAVAGFGTILDTLKTRKVAQSLTGFLQASRLADVSDAAASASVFARGMVLDDAMGVFGRMGPAGRLLGGAGGLLGVVGGVQQILGSSYEEQGGLRWRADQVAGGLSIIGGGGTLLMMTGLVALGPVGIGVVVGAGVVAGAWALGNLVYDNWDAIQGFASDPTAYLADGWNDVKNVASDVADSVGDGVSAAADTIGDGLDKAGDFIGGLFS